MFERTISMKLTAETSECSSDDEFSSLFGGEFKSLVRRSSSFSESRRIGDALRDS